MRVRKKQLQSRGAFPGDSLTPTTVPAQTKLRLKNAERSVDRGLRCRAIRRSNWLPKLDRNVNRSRLRLALLWRRSDFDDPELSQRSVPEFLVEAELTAIQCGLKRGNPIKPSAFRNSSHPVNSKQLLGFDTLRSKDTLDS